MQHSLPLTALTVALQVAAYALVLLHVRYVRPMQQDHSMLFAHGCPACHSELQSTVIAAVQNQALRRTTLLWL